MNGNIIFAARILSSYRSQGQLYYTFVPLRIQSNRGTHRDMNITINFFLHTEGEWLRRVGKRKGKGKGKFLPTTTVAAGSVEQFVYYHIQIGSYSFKRRS
jgi:hypothetical protein